jgi:DNA mismatch endonuclease, patch repair protein
MRAVKSRDTSAEMTIRRLVYSMGYRYRLHRKDLPGNPDLTFLSRRKVIFVHGCFWHGHNCKRGARMPKTNRDYWTRKISRNRDRDAQHVKTLEQQGWNVAAIWECQMKDQEALRKQIRWFLSCRSRNPSPCP